MNENSQYSTLKTVLLWSIIIPLVVVPIGFIVIMLTRLIIKPSAIGIMPTWQQCFWVGIGTAFLLMTWNLNATLKENQEDYLKEVAANPNEYQVNHPDGAYDYKIVDKNKIVFVTPPKQFKMKLDWGQYTYEYDFNQIVGFAEQSEYPRQPDYPQPQLYLIGNNDGQNRTFYISQAPDRITDTRVTLKCYDTHKKHSEAYFTRTFDDYGGPDAKMVQLRYVEKQNFWWKGTKDERSEDVYVTGEPIRGADGLHYSQRIDWAIIQTILYVICACHLFNAHYTAVRIKRDLDAIETS